VKRTISTLFAASAIAVFAAAPTAAQSQDIVDIAAGSEDFSTLVAAVKAAGLVETLKSDGPFSLLQPENRDKLIAILTYHVVPGKVMASDVAGLRSAKTVQGEALEIKIADGTPMIDNARVIGTDIEATNGVIHVIDTVVLPEGS
jgi:uncharacterized surface protein with fasciclin (FAS1) repeats